MSEITKLSTVFAAASANYTLTLNGTNIFQISQADTAEDMVNQINLHSDETGVKAIVADGNTDLTAEDGRNITIDVSAAQQGFVSGTTEGA
jgi:hypothetical protein